VICLGKDEREMFTEIRDKRAIAAFYGQELKEEKKK
jgi:hypothetical protein